MFAQTPDAVLTAELARGPRLSMIANSIRQSLLVPGLLSETQRIVYRARLASLILAIEEKRAAASPQRGEA